MICREVFSQIARIGFDRPSLLVTWRAELTGVSFSTHSPSMPDQRRPAFFWFIVLLSGIYLAFLAFTIHAIASHYGVLKDPGWTLRLASSGWFVSGVQADGPAAGKIEIGDRLLAFKGDERAAVIGASISQRLGR